MMPHATLPAWSKDGEWLAYNFMDGSSGSLPLYVSKKDGSGQKSLGVKSNDTPAWSPDGEWLVYERDTNIYKFNLQTGQEIKIFEGGASPDWRKVP
jgi:Tol biopolymer transport system component